MLAERDAELAQRDAELAQRDAKLAELADSTPGEGVLPPAGASETPPPSVLPPPEAAVLPPRRNVLLVGGQRARALRRGDAREMEGKVRGVLTVELERTLEKLALASLEGRRLRSPTSSFFARGGETTHRPCASWKMRERRARATSTTPSRKPKENGGVCGVGGRDGAERSWRRLRRRRVHPSRAGQAVAGWKPSRGSGGA